VFDDTSIVILPLIVLKLNIHLLSKYPVKIFFTYSDALSFISDERYFLVNVAAILYFLMFLV